MTGLMTLLGCAALTMDLGYYGLVTLHVQDVADACALAGAGGPIIGHDSWVAERLVQTLEVNQQAANPAALDDSQTQVYGGGQRVPNYGVLAACDEAITVVVQCPVHLTFSRAFGVSDRTITCSATALRTASAEGTAPIFATNSDPAGYGVRISGSHVKVAKAIHSNTCINLTGSDLVFKGMVEWVNELTSSGTGVRFTGGSAESTVQPPPFAYTPDDFGPYTYTVHGDYVVSVPGYRVPAGCYRVNGKVSITAPRVRMQNVTFVADGPIVLGNSLQRFSPNRRGVFAYSLSTSATSAIVIGGSGQSGSGTLYAPSGEISLSGSGSLMSTMLAQSISISGNNYILRPSPPTADGRFVSKLVE